MTSTRPEWLFDDSPIEDPLGRGDKAVRFIRALKHPKSKATGRAFELTRWQERIIRRTYGPRNADGTRVVRNVVMLLPRGSRKTSLGAALTLLHTFGPERETGGEVIVAASDRKQARIAYSEAMGIIGESKVLSGATHRVDSRNRIMHPNSGSVMEAISADAGTQHGRTPTMALLDEVHAWKKRDLYDVISSGMVKVPGTLQIVITTAGRGQENIAWEIVDYARKVALGDIDDPTTLPILFETAADADWRSEEVWRLANPGLIEGGFPDIVGLRKAAREAENRPGGREAFRQLNINVWLDHNADPFVEMAVYDEGKEPIDFDRLRGEPCHIAMDLSVTTDLSAVVAAWRDPDDDETFIVLPHFFCPANNLRVRGDRDGVPYPRWAEEGFITPTPGDVIDYRAVVDCVCRLHDEYQVAEIVFDRAYAMPVVLELQDRGIECLGMPLDPKSQSQGVAILERAIGARKFKHGGHPVLRWNMANVAIYTGHSGLRTMSKGRSTDRIDGAFAAWMAVARAANGETGRSIYADTETRPEGLLVF